MTIEEAKRIHLSANFTLWEFLYSEDAIKYGLLDKQLEITEAEILHLKKLCANILQPLRNYLGVSIRINSGYRSKELNEKVKGNPNSEHMLAKAADIYIPGKMKDAFTFIKTRCKFRQLIDESNLTWIHVSFSEFDNKMEVLYL